MSNFYAAIGLTDGTDGQLDALDGDLLADKDGAFVLMNGVFRAYVLDADSGLAESSPSIISPDTNAGTKRWILDSTNGFNVKAFGAKGDGSTDDETAIEAAITAAAVNGGIVFFPATGNAYKFLTAITVPSNVTLMFAPGASLMGDGSSTITLAGGVVPTNHKMFESTMTVNSISNMGSLNPRWWGATGDGVTDDTAAFNAVIALAAITGDIIFVPAGHYRLTQLDITQNSITIIGAVIPWQEPDQSTAGVSYLDIRGGANNVPGVLIGIDPDVNGTFLLNLRLENLRITVDPNKDIGVRLWMVNRGVFKYITYYGNTDTDGSDNIGWSVEGGVFNDFYRIAISGHRFADGSTEGTSADWLQFAMSFKNGYNNSVTTTTSVRKSYFNLCFRCIEILPDTHMSFSFCVFESTGDYAVFTNQAAKLSFDTCWFENVDYVGYFSDSREVNFQTCLFNIAADPYFFYPLGYTFLNIKDCKFAGSAYTSIFWTGGQSNWRAILTSCGWPSEIQPADSVMVAGMSLPGAKLRLKVIDHVGNLVFGDKVIEHALTVGVDGADQGTLTLWDGPGGNTPAYILLHSPNGTARYLFIEDDGTFKIHTSAPTANADGSAVGYVSKYVIKTIGIAGSGKDFTFASVANTTEQQLDLGALLPAGCVIVSVVLECDVTVTDGADQTMSIDVGITSGTAALLTTSDTDSDGDTNVTAAGSSPVLGHSTAARNVWINATPGVNWSTLTAAEWSIIIRYDDLGAVRAQKGL